MLSCCNKYSIFMDRLLHLFLFILFFSLLLNKIYEKIITRLIMAIISYFSSTCLTSRAQSIILVITNEKQPRLYTCKLDTIFHLSPICIKPSVYRTFQTLIVHFQSFTTSFIYHYLPHSKLPLLSAQSINR